MARRSERQRSRGPGRLPLPPLPSSHAALSRRSGLPRTGPRAGRTGPEPRATVYRVLGPRGAGTCRLLLCRSPRSPNTAVFPGRCLARTRAVREGGERALGGPGAPECLPPLRPGPPSLSGALGSAALLPPGLIRKGFLKEASEDMVCVGVSQGPGEPGCRSGGAGEGPQQGSG